MPTSFEEEVLKKTGFDNPLGSLKTPLKYKPSGTPYSKPPSNDPTGQLADSLNRQAPLDTRISPQIKNKIAKSIQDIDKAFANAYGKSHAGTQTTPSPAIVPKTPVEEDYFSPAAVEKRARAGFGLNQKHLSPHIRHEYGVQENIKRIEQLRSDAHRIKYKKPTLYSRSVTDAKIALHDGKIRTEFSISNQLTDNTDVLKASLMRTNKLEPPNTLKSRLLKLKDRYYFQQELNARIKTLKQGHYDEVGLLHDSYDSAVRKHEAIVTTNKEIYKRKLENADIKNTLGAHSALSESKEELLNIRTTKARRTADLKLKHKQEIEYLKRSHKLTYKRDMSETDLRKSLVKKEFMDEKKSIKDQLSENKRKMGMGRNQRAFRKTLSKIRATANQQALGRTLSKIPARAAVRLQKAWRFFKV